MTITKLTRTVAVALLGLTAPVVAQTSKVDQAVTKAYGLVDTNKTEKAIEAADKLAKEGTAEALLGASRIQKYAGKLEEAAASAAKALDAQGPADIKARAYAHAAELDILRGTA